MRGERKTPITTRDNWIICEGMRELFKKLKKTLLKGEGAAIASIIESEGSTPRGAGSRMLVKGDGTALGTVGGGAVEYQVTLACQEAVKKKESGLKTFTLTRGKEADIGMVCGGDVTVYIQYVDPQMPGILSLTDQVLGLLDVDEDSWLILDLTEEASWKMGLYSEKTGVLGLGNEGAAADWMKHSCPSGSAKLPEDPKGETKEPEEKILPETVFGPAFGKLFGSNAAVSRESSHFYYTEPLVQSGTAYVFGGGHVAQELVPVLKRVGFRCVIMDDREMFANKEVFPDADQIIVGDMERIGDYVSIRPQDYVCVMTRGHQFDYYVQKQTLALKPCYLGVMGSKNKIRVVTERLLEDGFTLEEIQSCRMPIGLGIHAETPAEIAVSVAAQMIAVRAERMGKTRR